MNGNPSVDSLFMPKAGAADGMHTVRSSVGRQAVGDFM